MLASNFIATKHAPHPPHTRAMTQLPQAKIDQKDLTIVRLDLAHAYGSIHHRLMEKVLEHYINPDQIRHLIMNYFSDIQTICSCERFLFSWRTLKKGVVTGCTISVLKQEVQRQIRESVCQQKTLSTEIHIQAMRVLIHLDQQDWSKWPKRCL